MKKLFILCIIALSMFSCVSVQTYSYKGNVTLLSSDGNKIESWNNATLSKGDNYCGTYNTPYVNGGVEITTEQGELIYINGGIIIVKNIGKIINEYEQPEIDNSTESKLKEQYIKINNEICTNKKTLKSLPKNSNEYKSIKEDNKKLKSQLNIISNQYFELTGNYIQTDIAIGG